MKFFKNLKESILGSIKEDLNSALGQKQTLFNSKISSALDDLIAMKTGINISNIPSKVTEKAALSAEARRKKVKNIDELQSQAMKTAPSQRTMLRFPTSNDRFVDNWIVFRTLPRSIDGDHMRGKTFESNGEHGINVHESTYTNPPTTGQGSRNNGIERYKFTADQRECSIALYFPNNVKDTIQVDYETKEVGLGDATLNEIFSSGGGLNFGDAISEGLTSMQQSMIAMTALQKGVAAGNPKFLNYQGVGMREHQYTFTLNPYNENDAKEITAIIHWFKLMSLPMSSNKNPRIMILPAEWSINFMGPILGQIEHPQNCFLSTVDVDYSGGKDMSFIEAASADVRTKLGKNQMGPPEPNPDDELGKNHTLQHYPNGITLSLTFKEILNVDRLRYIGKVAAAARGANQDVLTELENFEYGRGDEMGTGTQTTESGDRVGD